MPHEETRKIIKLGHSYVVSMPRAWLRYFKLSEKDEVLMISDGIVEIRPPIKEGVRVHE